MPPENHDQTARSTQTPVQPPSRTPEQSLAALGLSLPVAPKPVAAYVPCVRSGNLLFISGQLPFRDGKLLATGRAGVEVTLEQAIDAAKMCALNVLAVAKSAVGDLQRVRQVVRLGVFVASGDAFVDQPKVANGASELMAAVFGEAGRHARAAVGTNTLPLGATVEVEAVLEVD